MSRFLVIAVLLLGLIFASSTYAVDPKIVKDREYYENRPEGVDRMTWVNDYLKLYPRTKDGKYRQVILLPELKEEHKGNRIVEVRAGKKMEIQPCGDHLIETDFALKEFPSQWSRVGKVLKYYELKFGEVNRSIIYCTKGRTTEFVEGENILIPVESDHPIVVYTTEKAVITYRVWDAATGYEKAEPFRAYYLDKS